MKNHLIIKNIYLTNFLFSFLFKDKLLQLKMKTNDEIIN